MNQHKPDPQLVAEMIAALVGLGCPAEHAEAMVGSAHQAAAVAMRAAIDHIANLGMPRTDKLSVVSMAMQLLAIICENNQAKAESLMRATGPVQFCEAILGAKATVQ